MREKKKEWIKYKIILNDNIHNWLWLWISKCYIAYYLSRDNCYLYCSMFLLNY
jgi:hypothetical protein